MLFGAAGGPAFPQSSARTASASCRTTPSTRPPCETCLSGSSRRWSGRPYNEARSLRPCRYPAPGAWTCSHCTTPRASKAFRAVVARSAMGILWAADRSWRQWSGSIPSRLQHLRPMCTRKSLWPLRPSCGSSPAISTTKRTRSPSSTWPPSQAIVAASSMQSLTPKRHLVASRRTGVPRSGFSRSRSTDAAHGLWTTSSRTVRRYVPAWCRCATSSSERATCTNRCPTTVASRLCSRYDAHRFD
mmetsp:Transcript_116756/g.330294  ORF Transcript_116756/g.330294 Transcript_116756/m.330294 type:complete len:245 (+) Transcript_116756:731-1465(+)